MLGGRKHWDLHGGGVWASETSGLRAYIHHNSGIKALNSKPQTLGEQVAVGPGFLKHHILYILCIG